MNRRSTRIWSAGVAFALLIPVHAFAEASRAVPAEAGTWQPQHTAFGVVRTRRESTLRLPFSARITELPVEPGVRVAAGDVLVRFDAPSLHQHLQAWLDARRVHHFALERRRILRESLREHTATRHQVAQSEQTAAEAEAALRLAWETLAADLDVLNLPAEREKLARRVEEVGLAQTSQDLGRFRAPFAGIVVRRDASEGEQLAQGAAILDVEALDRVYIDVGVPRADLADWQAGQSRWDDGSSVVELQATPGAPRYDPGSGLWLLRFQTRSAEASTWDGAWVEVRHLGPAQPVAWVPRAAVVARNGRTWCVVEDERGVRPAPVRVGEVQGGERVPVLEGLAPGARVVTEGAYELLYRDLKELIRFED